MDRLIPCGSSAQSRILLSTGLHSGKVMIKARISPEDSDAAVTTLSKVYRDFSWPELEKEFTCAATGNLNIVQEAVDRWARNRDTRERTALIFEKSGTVQEFTYQELREISCQWANMLIESGVGEGDRVFVFLPNCAEIYFAMLACARIGAIFSILYPDLHFDELDVRFANSKPKGVVTHPDLVGRIPQHALTSLDCIWLVQGPTSGLPVEEIVVPQRIEDLPKKSIVQWVRGSAPLYIAYTSGGTGPPKGVVHAHQDMLGLLMTGRHVLNLKEKSRLWTDADPGWVAGTLYGAFAPWLCGSICIVQGDAFSPATSYRTLERHQVEVWYTTPRKLALLRQAGEDLVRRYDLSRLKHIATAGEALDPEVLYWAKETLGHAPHETWAMAETGMICLANFSAMAIKPGSIGKPVPGIEAAVLDDNGEPLPPLVTGELALKEGWPSVMTGIWHDPPRYQQYFRFKGWFLTGDTVTRDEEDYYYHQGRNDDLLKLGDRAIGPYEIEQVLAIHPAVREAAAIAIGSSSGKTVVKVFVALAEGFPEEARLTYDLKAFLSANFPPDFPLAEIVILDEMPKSRTGKPLRRVLRAMEQGLPSGDVSKLKE